MSVIRTIITLVIWVVALPVFVLMLVTGIVLSYIMHPKYFYWIMHLNCKILLLASWQYHTIHGQIPPKNEGEDDMLDQAYKPQKNSRLSCQIEVSDVLEGLEVNLPEKQV